MGNAGVGGVVSLPGSTPLSISGTRGLYSVLSLLYRWRWNERPTRVRMSTKTHTNPSHTCCVYLTLRQAGRARPLVRALLRPSPSQAAEARMVWDFTSLATQRSTATHPPITGLDCWTDTGIRTGNQHIISYGWKRWDDNNISAWIKVKSLNWTAACSLFTEDSWGTPGVWLVVW